MPRIASVILSCALAVGRRVAEAEELVERALLLHELAEDRGRVHEELA
jgi:hypothetical protein